MALAIDRGWLTRHESGTYVRFTPPVLICSRSVSLHAVAVGFWPLADMMAEINDVRFEGKSGR